MRDHNYRERINNFNTANDYYSHYIKFHCNTLTLIIITNMRPQAFQVNSYTSCYHGIAVDFVVISLFTGFVYNETQSDQRLVAHINA
jgi:hypothetical protein